MNTNLEAASEALRIGYGDSKIGMFLVALSQRGVAAILLGDDRLKLRREVEGIFPGVELVGDGGGLSGEVAEIAALIDAPQHGLTLPLDMQGTDTKAQ